MACIRTSEAIEREYKRLKRLLNASKGLENERRIRYRLECFEWFMCKRMTLEP